MSEKSCDEKKIPIRVKSIYHLYQIWKYRKANYKLLHLDDKNFGEMISKVKIIEIVSDSNGYGSWHRALCTEHAESKVVYVQNYIYKWDKCFFGFGSKSIADWKHGEIYTHEPSGVKFRFLKYGGGVWHLVATTYENVVVRYQDTFLEKVSYSESGSDRPVATYQSPKCLL